MRILISNDDGITAPGLQALLQPLKEAGHEILVAAPTFENSASSHAITVHDPIFVCDHEFADPAIKGWSISGRPADCVKIALEVLTVDNLPDLVVSGINRGPNMGLDTVYSGTVAAALEASMHEVPAIAFSLDSRSRQADYSVAASYVAEIIQLYFKLNLPKSTTLNVNFPPVGKDKIKGIKLAKLGNVAYDNVFAPRHDLQGRRYYWLGGELVKQTGCDLAYDVDAVGQNWITMTPLWHDMTDYESFAKIEKITF